MIDALALLDSKLPSPVRLIVGGGSAMLLAHNYPLASSDIDAIPASGISLDELSPFIREVAEEFSLPVDWLNPFYASFTHVLPSDYGTRLVDVCKFSKLTASALSKTDLLIMKCFAGRLKDVVHARSLVKNGADVAFVKTHIGILSKKRIPGCDRALKFLGEIEAFFAEADA